MKQKFAIITSIIVMGCANNTCSKISNSNPDPLEGYNRAIFNMNRHLDKAIIRPITVGYTYIPTPIRNPINNFFNNLRDFITLANDILQLKGMEVMQNTMRIGINSVVGIIGLIDVASNLGLPRHTNSFGKTLQVYGWTNSSYFVLPILGPSTIRDTIGLVPDVYFNPTWYLISDYYISIGLYVVNLIDIRSKFLNIDETIENTSLDLYITVRDTYLQSVQQSSTRSDIVNINDFLMEDINKSSIESKSVH